MISGSSVSFNILVFLALQDEKNNPPSRHGWLDRKKQQNNCNEIKAVHGGSPKNRKYFAQPVTLETNCQVYHFDVKYVSFVVSSEALLSIRIERASMLAVAADTAKDPVILRHRVPAQKARIATIDLLPLVLQDYTLNTTLKKKVKTICVSTVRRTSCVHELTSVMLPG